VEILFSIPDEPSEGEEARIIASSTTYKDDQSTVDGLENCVAPIMSYPADDGSCEVTWSVNPPAAGTTVDKDGVDTANSYPSTIIFLDSTASPLVVELVVRDDDGYACSAQMDFASNIKVKLPVWIEQD
jgi:hypothetical protein